MEVAIAEVVPGDLVRWAPATRSWPTAASSAARRSAWTSRSSPARPSRSAGAVGDEVRAGSYAVEGSGAYVAEAVGQRHLRRAAGGRGARVPPPALAARAGARPADPDPRRRDGAPGRPARLVADRAGHARCASRSRPPWRASSRSSPRASCCWWPSPSRSRRCAWRAAGALSQQLNAVESLASVDVICLDKTGTLTEETLRVVELVPRRRRGGGRVLDRSSGASPPARRAATATLDAVAAFVPGDARADRRERALRLAPALERRADGRAHLRPGRARALRARRDASARACAAEAAAGRRVLALAAGDVPADAAPRRTPRRPAGLAPLGLVVLAEELRPDTRETIAFLLEEGIEIRVISGDAPATVAAIAADAGIPLRGRAGGRPRAAARATPSCASWCARTSDRRAHLARRQAALRGGARRRRIARRDGGRRRQRRARPEGGAPGDRPGQRVADGARGSPTSCW